MEYLINYFIIGLIISFLMSEVLAWDNEEPNDEPEEVTFVDQFWFTVLWPLMLFLVGKEFVKNYH